MKIFIVGSGGVGGYFGGLLAKADNDVAFVARGNHFKEIKKNGLKIKSVTGNFIIMPAQVIKSISDIKNPDLIIFTIKTYDTESAVKELSKVVKQNTIVLTFQNGVDNDLKIKEVLKNNKVCPGVAYIISAKTKPGLIEQTGGMRKLIFGDRNKPQNPRLKEIQQLMKNADINSELSNDITRDLWKKFIFISAFSGMTAVCRSPIGKVLQNPLAKSLYETCIKETISVAKAMKVNLESDIFAKTMKISKNTAPKSKSSLLVDIENKRRNEIEAINGTIVKYAREYNIDVPINKLIYTSIKLTSQK